MTVLALYKVVGDIEQFNPRKIKGQPIEKKMSRLRLFEIDNDLFISDYIFGKEIKGDDRKKAKKQSVYKVGKGLKKIFKEKGYSLSYKATVSRIEKREIWTIRDGSTKFSIKDEKKRMCVYHDSLLSIKATPKDDVIVIEGFDQKHNPFTREENLEPIIISGFIEKHIIPYMLLNISGRGLLGVGYIKNYLENDLKELMNTILKEFGNESLQLEHIVFKPYHFSQKFWGNEIFAKKVTNISTEFGRITLEISGAKLPEFLKNKKNEPMVKFFKQSETIMMKPFYTGLNCSIVVRSYGGLKPSRDLKIDECRLLSRDLIQNDFMGD
jgi:hypothetical protein